MNTPQDPAAALAELAALEKAILRHEAEIARLNGQLAAMRDRQAARRQELGFQRARLGLRPGGRVSEEARPGHRLVLAQTDAGLAARWLPDDLHTTTP